MKLLIFTQKVDKSDSVLGFFHRWIEEFSKGCESVIVICLYEGKHSLPANVRVLSLGKEKKQSRFNYVVNFYKYIWGTRKEYNKVFVHMNQEYLLLGGIFWKLWRKPAYLWRNHHAGSFLTDIAAAFCTKVFCTSRFSFTAKYKKTTLMPVGVDIENFKPDATVSRIDRSILSLGRISPSKNNAMLVDVVVGMKDPSIHASIYGDPLPQDQGYYDMLKEKASTNIVFKSGIPNTETVKVYSAHSIFVNMSSSGMYDKTIFEAMACGCLILASNENLRGQIPDDFIFRQGDEKELAEKLGKLLNYDRARTEESSRLLQEFAKKHSLAGLRSKLLATI